MFRPYGVIIRSSLWNILFKICLNCWDPKQCNYIIDWLHVSTLWGHHQVSTMNHFVKKLRTFLGSQTMFIFLGSQTMFIFLGSQTMQTLFRIQKMYPIGSNTTSFIIYCRLATCFNPMGSSSGFHYEPFCLKSAYIVGIPNNVNIV